ncbi:hypothetical protein [Actinoplanes siamensis]|uniref:HEAT repeat protein n=1 Tax=Actinoplanes siamensis TaxID=1223317 RepID=A0A919N721_9ACTN|nr:hypothetical protein [Actinoplanes siamensis]GIF05474.1 hypothetical protein Asi03nite_30120 [Actinoplanes siamensis]
MTQTDSPLTGLHDVDWASLDRGPAVRQMLTDLAGGDAAARAAAWGGLYRSAPDGEDVRPWVAAALPTMLALVTDPGQPERGRLLRLIGDLAGADRTWQRAGETLRAKTVLAGSDRLAELLVDEDPLVRDAAAYTVRAVCRMTPGWIELLWGRYVEEPDPTVRVTILRSAVIAGATGGGYEPTKIWLAWVADGDADLKVRITALTELTALLNPPPFDVETARDTVLAAYRAGLNREPEPLDDLAAPLLAGRRMAARQWTPGYPQVVSAIRTSYRNDVAAQLELFGRMLEMDGWDARQDALCEARVMVQRLRGPYPPLVRRAAELLADPDPQVRAAALRLLHGIGELARPAADAVWSGLSRAGQRVWVTRGPRGPVLGAGVQMLAGLRDERLLPMLHRLLDEAPDTGDLHRSIAGYGFRARGLSRTLRRRLRGLPPGVDPAHRAGLLRALTAVAPNEAADHLAEEPIDLTTLGLLAQAGRAAGDRTADIEAALTTGDPAVELAAAHAVWRVAGDAEAAAAVYDRWFDDGRAAAEHQVAAIDGLKELGIRVRSRAHRLSRLLRGKADGTVVAAAADALWWVAGQRDAARTLGRVWESAPRARPRIARLWTATGDTRYGARYARAEIGNPVRHNASIHGMLPAQVTEDERLLALCREIVAQGS